MTQEDGGHGVSLLPDDTEAVGFAWLFDGWSYGWLRWLADSNPCYRACLPTACVEVTDASMSMLAVDCFWMRTCGTYFVLVTNSLK